MFTEPTLKDFSLNVLYDLMVVKLEELEQMEEKESDIQLRIITREELELIQNIIDERERPARNFF